MHIQKLKDIIPPPSEITVDVSNQITLLLLHAIISRFVTLLKVICVPLTLVYSREILFMDLSKIW